MLGIVVMSSKRDITKGAIMSITTTKTELAAVLRDEFIVEGLDAETVAEVTEVINAIEAQANAHRGEFHTFSDYLDVDITAHVG